MKGSKFVAVDFTKVMSRILGQINRASLCWDYVRGNRALEDILNTYFELRYEMNSRVQEKTISENSRSRILKEIEKRLKNTGATNLTVLLGGPPCQLYSIIGRSRYSSMKDKFYRDPRRRLFEHYIFFSANFNPISSFLRMSTA
jgi:site-specific DNA-cytosine methylase